MKLTKVHIALLTNVTEGKVKNEHITMYYGQEVKAVNVLRRMGILNKALPVDLFHAANKNMPVQFNAWGGERISSIGFNSFEPEYRIFNDFKVSLPHITLAKEQTIGGRKRLEKDWPKFNWNEGLKVGECHVGWKENGEMVYRTENELIEWIANNA